MYIQSNQPQDDLPVWLMLSQIPNFGPATLERLVTQLKIIPAELFEQSQSTLRANGLTELQVKAICKPDLKAVEKLLSWQQAHEMHFIVCASDSAYSSQLTQIARPPFLLFGKGNQALINQSQIAIVGSRNPTYYGKQTAIQLAEELASRGLTITSGLALGIDACAHQGALNVSGHTLAVLGSGVDQIYPKRNQQLAENILQHNGLLLSEFAPSVLPKAENFPRRNRIVSGLSLGVLIVEAAMKSGSLITARLALEQNREVFAVPGNINSPLSKGCHYLIKQGAKVVEDCADVLDELQNINSCVLDTDVKNLQKSQNQSLAYDKLLDSVDLDVTALDVIIQRSELPIKVVLAQLLEFELRGLVAPVSGGYVKLRGK